MWENATAQGHRAVPGVPLTKTLISLFCIQNVTMNNEKGNSGKLLLHLIYHFCLERLEKISLLLLTKWHCPRHVREITTCFSDKHDYTLISIAFSLIRKGDYKPERWLKKLKCGHVKKTRKKNCISFYKRSKLFSFLVAIAGEVWSLLHCLVFLLKYVTNKELICDPTMAARKNYSKPDFLHFAQCSKVPGFN